MDILKKIQRLHHSIIPTPIHRLNNISNHLNIDLYIKRDDLTGFAFGGSKTRKLDFIVADALQKKANCLISAGGNQSNFCRTLAAYASYYNMDCYLYFGEKIKQSGNQILNRLFNAKSIYAKPDIMQYIKSLKKTINNPLKVSNNLNPQNNLILMKNYINCGFEKYAKKLQSIGKKPQIVPLGGSSPLGILGYVESFLEIDNQMKKNNINFDKIVLTCGSCGTYAGMLIGSKLLNQKGKLIGISVSFRKNHVIQEIIELVDSMKKYFHNISAKKEDVIVQDQFIGNGYAKKTLRGTKAIKLMASKEGIIMDNVYTGKAFAGLLDNVEKGIIRKNEKVLFNLTGGSPEIFS